jgi:hypothetical protein
MRNSTETQNSGETQNSSTSQKKSNSSLAQGSAKGHPESSHERQERLDRMDAESFPASDAPSHTPHPDLNSSASNSAQPDINAGRSHGVGPDANDKADREDFKNNSARQFRYGRQSEQSTLHFDPTSKRLETGNPDVGNVDLGTIEADQPAQPDESSDLDPENDY